MPLAATTTTNAVPPVALNGRGGAIRKAKKAFADEVKRVTGGLTVAETNAITSWNLPTGRPMS